MDDKWILTEEELASVHGGTRPEEIGEPIPIQYYNRIIESYRVCEKCGAAMFPVRTKVVINTLTTVPPPDYQCSECENRHHNMPIFIN